MTSNFERFQEIQKQADSESYSSLCHLEPKKAPKLSNLAPLWSGPLYLTMIFQLIRKLWFKKKLFLPIEGCGTSINNWTPPLVTHSRQIFLWQNNPHKKRIHSNARRASRVSRKFIVPDKSSNMFSSLMCWRKSCDIRVHSIFAISDWN